MNLSPEEVRVLGCLVEKAYTTPDHYPLTDNALRAACNQKSSRHPVVDYSLRQVSEVMMELRQQKLARTVHGSGRASKHKHVLDEAWGLGDKKLALMGVLALRGPQTPGELRTRTERYCSFESVTEVEAALAELGERAEPLVVCLGRGAGQSQDRWTHLLQGEPITEVAVTPTRVSRSDLEARVEALEERILALETALGVN